MSICAYGSGFLPWEAQSSLLCSQQKQHTAFPVAFCTIQENITFLCVCARETRELISPWRGARVPMKVY